MDSGENGNGHAEMLKVGGRILSLDDATALLEILQQRYPGALGGAMAELWTGVAYSVKAPGVSGKRG